MNRYIELYRYYVNYLNDKFVKKMMNICSIRKLLFIILTSVDLIILQTF